MKCTNRLIAFTIEYGEANPVPVVSCMTQAQQAQLMLDFAKKYQIPVFERPELENALLSVPEGSEIPDCLYKAIALILLAIESS